MQNAQQPQAALDLFGLTHKFFRFLRAPQVTHGRFDILPADLLHQLLDVPAASAGPAGKATAHGVAAVLLGRHDPGFREEAAPQGNQAVGVQAFVSHMSPAVDLGVISVSVQIVAV